MTTFEAGGVREGPFNLGFATRAKHLRANGADAWDTPAGTGLEPTRTRSPKVVGRLLASPVAMIRKLAHGGYRLYSRKKDPKTGKRRNLGTFSTRAAAEKHERAVQYFKHH